MAAAGEKAPCLKILRDSLSQTLRGAPPASASASASSSRQKPHALHLQSPPGRSGSGQHMRVGGRWRRARTVVARKLRRAKRLAVGVRGVALDVRRARALRFADRRERRLARPAKIAALAAAPPAVVGGERRGAPAVAALGVDVVRLVARARDDGERRREREREERRAHEAAGDADGELKKISAFTAAASL